MNYVILAGGSGTRLWPMSRDSKPKQLAQLVSDLSMIEDTIHRLDGITSLDQIFISTNSKFADMIKELVPDIPVDHYIIEPEKRDTGPAMAFVAAWMSLRAPDEPMAFIPSDHFIRDVKVFEQTFMAAEEIIKTKGTMLDIGILPTFPNVHLGYTRIGDLIEDKDGIHFYQFAGHTEKPNYETAKSYLDQGDYLWHANYYMWTPSKFVEAYRTYAPAIGDQLEPIKKAISANDSKKIAELYSQMEKISIDYAVAEKMDPANVLIIRGDFGWADLGSWDMLYDELGHQADSEGNLVKASWHGVDTRNTLIYAPKDKLVTTIGVSDLVIVDTPDALLVTPMSRAQDVKKIVELLKEKGLHQHL